MKNFLIITIFLTLFSNIFAQAQITQVRSALRQVATGKIWEAKAELKKLKEQYPEDAGVVFLEATLTDNAKKALPLYIKIIDSYPKNEYADDAYCRIVQYYAIARDTVRARKELDNYRAKYPTSEFLLLASDVVRTAVGLKPAVKPAEDKSAKAHIASDKTATIKKTEAKPDTTKKSSSSEPKRFGLQVGAYGTKEAAEKEKERFLKLRLKTAIEKKPINGAILFAVVIGNYSSEEKAKEARDEVKKKCGCDPQIYIK